MGDTINFDYYYGIEAEQFSFYRVPRLLIKDERFKGLSSDAKLLYGLMLDRMSLSMKNGWLDKISRYFTEDYSSEDIENIIYQLLEEWQNIFGRDLGASIMRLPSLELLCRRLSTSKKIKMEQSH